MKSLSRVRLFATPWTIAYQVPPSMEFSKQEYWNGLPFPSSEDLPNPGIEPTYPVASALAGRFFITEPPGKPKDVCVCENESECLSLVSDSCGPMDYTVHGILQARILKWVAISFFRGSSQPRDQTHIFDFSCIGKWVFCR